MAKSIFTLRQYKLNINNKIVRIFQVHKYRTGYDMIQHYFDNKKAGMLLPCTEYFVESKKSGENLVWSLEDIARENSEEVYDISVHGSLHKYDWSYNEEDKTNYATLSEIGW